MSRILVAMLAAALFVSVGCSDKDKEMKKDDAKMMSADVCSHCAGVQKATAEGKCEACGAKVSAKMMSADACAACPGVQKANADGKCPECSKK